MVGERERFSHGDRNEIYFIGSSLWDFGFCWLLLPGFLRSFGIQHPGLQLGRPTIVGAFKLIPNHISGISNPISRIAYPALTNQYHLLHIMKFTCPSCRISNFNSVKIYTARKLAGIPLHLMKSCILFFRY